MADATTHTSAKTSGLSSDPLRGTPAKNRAGWSTTLRATSTKLPTGLENSNSSPDPDLLMPIFAPSCRLLVCEPAEPCGTQYERKIGLTFSAGRRQRIYAELEDARALHGSILS